MELCVRNLMMNFLTVCTFLLEAYSQEVCEQCDCSVSDHGNDQRGVKSVKPLCDEGTVTWYGPYGALRVELQYSRPGEYKACFVVESINTRLQVFRESWSNSKFSSSYKLPSTASLKPVTDVYGKSREFCMTSSTPVVLYLESVRTQEMSGLPHVTIQYLLENRNYIAEVDPLEDCRPCSKAELIMSYCSSDFVLEGRISNVTHNDTHEKTYVGVYVSRVLRQRDTDLLYRPYRDAKELYGHIVVPRKCKARKASGTFLFTGKVRFGEMTKMCSPYLNNWIKIAQTAIEEGDMLCPLR